MNWEEANLFDNFDKMIFLKDYGLCTVSPSDVKVNDVPIEQIFCYSTETDRYSKIIYKYNKFNKVYISDIFTHKLAIRKTAENNYNRYNDYLLSDSDVDEIKVNCINFNLKIDYWTDISGGKTNTCCLNVELKTIKDVDKYKCWVTQNYNEYSLKFADISGINEGDKLYIIGIGEVLIKAILDYPNNDEAYFKAIDIKGNEHTILAGSAIYYLPYDNKNDLIDEIDDAKYEQLLMPYVSKSNDVHGLYNIYWNSINEASRYIVSIYKLYDMNRGRLYHLADYEVERGIHYFVFDKLVGGNFVFKVSAEDRNGRIIAKSRGMVSGYPKTFRK